MKQYFIIKRPTKTEKILEKTAVEQLEREFQAIKAIGEHINLIRIEEYHNEDNIVYLAFEFAIATSLYHYLATMGVREGVNTISRNNEPWTRYLFRQFIAGL